MNWIQRLFLTPECERCKVLEETLAYERARFTELQETMISLLKPVPIIREGVNPNPKPISTAGKLWSRRRHELEKADRQAAHIKQTSPVIGKPDKEINEPVIQPEEAKPLVTPNPTPKTVSQLELELGVVESEGVH